MAPLPIGAHVEIAFARAPLLILLHEQRPHQAYHGCAGGEDADDALAPPDFLVEALLPIGGPQSSAIGQGQGQHGRRVVETGLQGCHCGGCLLLIVGDHLGQ